MFVLCTDIFSVFHRCLTMILIKAEICRNIIYSRTLTVPNAIFCVPAYTAALKLSFVVRYSQEKQIRQKQLRHVQPVQQRRGDLQIKLLTGKPDGKSLVAKPKSECQDKVQIKFNEEWRALDQDTAERWPHLKNVTNHKTHGVFLKILATNTL